jgi:hypothetical protein
MKAKINELFSNTMKIHELKLQKEGTLRSELLLQDLNRANGKAQPQESKKSREDREKPEKQLQLIKKKREDSSRDKKLELASKNTSSGCGFKKKNEP